MSPLALCLPAATVPVTVTGSAPTNSIFVDSTGRLGLSSNLPVFAGIDGRLVLVRRGSTPSSLVEAMADLAPGSPGASLLPELGPAPTDLVLTRLHGVGPMTGTDLDSVLRNLGIRTIVGVGVSVNIAITNFVMDAVNGGYQFVLPRDAVSGYPREYAESVIDNTLSLLATVTTTRDVVAAWARSS